MKKSTFISKVLKSRTNTLFVNKEQVDAAIALFEKFGMKAPKTTLKIEGTKKEIECNLWED